MLDSEEFLSVAAMARSKRIGPTPPARGSGGGQEPHRPSGDKGKAKVIEQTKKQKRKHREVEQALAAAAAYNRGVRGGRGGSLRIILSAIETQSLEPQQIEMPRLHRSSCAHTTMHSMPSQRQQEEQLEDPEEDLPPVPPR